MHDACRGVMVNERPILVTITGTNSILTCTNKLNLKKIFILTDNTSLENCIYRVKLKKVLGKVCCLFFFAVGEA